jgi:deazaflavin-dependent oxidoreductase (nitroreductase family)
MLLDAARAAADVCNLETIGRISGQRRLVELWFAAAPDRERIFFLSGGRDAADWVRNVAANPRVRVEVEGLWFGGVGRWIEGEADELVARRMLAAKYQDWREGRRLSAWARESLPVAVDLEALDRAG